MKELTYNNTPETMSLDEAVKLFEPFENGEFYKSCVLLEKVVPKEYLDNEEFFRRVITTRCAFTDPTIISYGSYKIQANEELAMMSIVHNDQLGGLVRTYYLPISEKVKKELKDNKQYIITEEKEGKIIVKSKLLEDKAFIDKLVKELSEHSCRYAYTYLAQYSKIFSSNDEYMLLAVSNNPSDFHYYTGKNIKAIVGKAVETMLKSHDFAYELESDFIAKQEESVQKLLNMCKKIQELPDNAKIREIIYRQICKHYLSSLKKEKTDEQTEEQTIS